MRKNIFVLIILIVSLSSNGCAKLYEQENSAVNDHTYENGSGQESNRGEDEKEVHIIRADGEKNNGLIMANNKFSWNIFKKINEEDLKKEVFISPLSISTMLTMALNGAGSTTKEEMEKALNYEEMSLEEINRGYAWLINRIQNIDPKVTIEMADSIWARDGFQILPDYIERNRSFLSAEVCSLNFDLPEAADTINNWISQKTHNLIPKMINSPIHPDVMMYLINAIYFKGEWTTAFKAKNTSEREFHALDGKTDMVSMMMRSGKIEYYKNNEYKAVSLPYGDENTAMVVILPDQDINQFIDRMNNDKWEELLDGLKPVQNLNLQLPKFKLEYGIKELKGALSALGIREAFSDKADFTGIAENLYINKILHKAVVDVNEEGTEAAAVTVGEISTTSFTEPAAFIADRPFLFIITDRQEGNILFMGKKIYGDR